MNFRKEHGARFDLRIESGRSMTLPLSGLMGKELHETNFAGNHAAGSRKAGLRRLSISLSRTAGSSENDSERERL
jgi:hypothetical protein